VKQLVNDSIPSEWRISPELLANYPAGSDIRPLAHTSGVLSSRELSITDTSLDATSLIEQLHSGAVSAEEAVTAFAKRAAVAHQAVTCLAGFYYEEALTKAKELDAMLKSTGKPVGPLHGKLISLHTVRTLSAEECTCLSNCIFNQDCQLV
jgi:amidase